MTSKPEISWEQNVNFPSRVGVVNSVLQHHNQTQLSGSVRQVGYLSTCHTYTCFYSTVNISDIEEESIIKCLGKRKKKKLIQTNNFNVSLLDSNERKIYESHIVKWNLNRCGHLDCIQLAGQRSQGCAELWHYFREEKTIHITISEMLLMPSWSGICSTGWTETVISKGQAAFPQLLKLGGVKWLCPKPCAVLRLTPRSNGWARQDKEKPRSGDRKG